MLEDTSVDGVIEAALIVLLFVWVAAYYIYYTRHNWSHSQFSWKLPLTGFIFLVGISAIITAIYGIATLETSGASKLSPSTIFLVFFSPFLLIILSLPIWTTVAVLRNLWRRFARRHRHG